MNSQPALDPEKIGLKVGIELHRQLQAERKLFCHCPIGKEEGSVSFVRRLRPSQSELGEVDPAALFEAQKEDWIKYQAGQNFSCIVEADEEPPHDPDPFSIETALMIALQLDSKVVDEIHVMRKMVIDGSNTSGFQRTMVVGLGGTLRWKNGPQKEVGVQTVTLEEDAARNIGEKPGERIFSLDRLGVPLIEISLSPVTASPAQVQDLAMSLGRLLKATGRVERGLGAIRQDVNISVMNGQVIEVKGVQQLELISKVVEFEARRQLWLHELASRVRERGINETDLTQSPRELTHLFNGTGSRVIAAGLKNGGVALGVKLPRMKGLISLEPSEGLRLGRELAGIARFYGLGGLLHSDELPGLGVTEGEVSSVKKALSCGDDDAFLLLVGESTRLRECIAALLSRLRQSLRGPPAETRAATPEGETRYLRPRPGSARMYPETDILPIEITEDVLHRVRKKIPKPWEEQVEACSSTYKISLEQAERILDSDYFELFEKVCSSTKLSPSVVVSILTDTLTAVRREEGMDVERITEELLFDLFKQLSEGKLAKEAVQPVLESISKGDADDVPTALARLGVQKITVEELRSIIGDSIKENMQLVEKKGEAAFSPIMGTVMARVRGRIDGSIVSSEVKSILLKVINQKKSEAKK
ncbi:MAG: Glu-tRNA(Gln) amidotransferase subunit GatE [Nitrososphaerota archaeon]|nr:Glu-tRNA(Gln) amidotransferase subunit GatE [Nitrososphaerota archaeon]